MCSIRAFHDLGPKLRTAKNTCAQANLASTVHVSALAGCASPLSGDAGHLTAVSSNSFKQIHAIERFEIRARSINILPGAAPSRGVSHHAVMSIVGIVMPLVDEGRATYTCCYRSSKSQSCDRRFMWCGDVFIKRWLVDFESLHDST